MNDPTGVPSSRHITSDGRKPSVSMYQRALRSKSGVSSTRWPSFVTCGGASAGRWVSLTRTVWFGALWGMGARTGCAATDAIDVRLRAGAAQEELVLALRDDQQSEVDEVVPRPVQVGALEMRVKQRVGLHCRRDA